MTCQLCGYSGTDVSEHRSYVGGKGYVWRIQCDNMVACSKRQDTQRVPERELVEVRA